MVIENIIPMIIGALFFLAVASVALVHTIYGRHDTRMYIYSFTILSLSSSLMALHWLDIHGEISSRHDNTNIFLFTSLLLAISFYVFGQRRKQHNK